MRTRLLILASSLAMLGWGTVLPYQYAYAADTRGCGSLVAAAASTLFSLGALVAAPIGGRLADRHSPVRVAVVAKVVAAVGVGALVWASTPDAFLAGMAVFGIGVTAAGPAQSLLALRWTGSSDRRRVFAWQFTGQALGMAIGAFAAGYVVDLHRLEGMRPAFLTAAAGFIVSAFLIALAARGTRGTRDAEHEAAIRDLGELPAAGVSRTDAIRAIWARPALRWTALVTVTLALGFYAQFESGLPAYALTILDVSPSTIGVASAVNCLVIIGLQMIVVRFTARRSSADLLVVVGAVWLTSWVLLALGSVIPGSGAWLFVGAFGVFGVGETMYAPILNPLTAELAPAGYVGTTLGLFNALQTGLSAAGPLVAGALLGAGWSAGFLGLHAAISALAVYAAWQLRRTLRRDKARAEHPARHPSVLVDAA